MILKALEDSDLPLVLATGGFTYQADYEALCRAFKRKGKTVFLPKIEPDLLASAFAASRLHVLPSFFELPGLVSLEAAKYGTNVVVSDYGTIRDYLGEDAIYCHPQSPESIFQAIQEGWDRPHSDRLQKRVEKFTWRSATERYIEIYSQVLEKYGRKQEGPTMRVSDHGDLGQLDAALQTIARASAEVSRAKETVSLIPSRVGNEGEQASAKEQAEELCAEGDRLTREGKLSEAVAKYKLASHAAPTLARAYRGLAVVALNESRYADSEGYFRRALLVDPTDMRSELGVAAVQSQTGRKREASQKLQAILHKEPTNILALRQYLQLAYEVSEYGPLENVLRAYLKEEPANPDMSFCLAGCIFKQGRNAEALEIVTQTLAAHPSHTNSKELRDLLLKASNSQVEQSTKSPSVKIPSTVIPAPVDEAPQAATPRMMSAAIRELEELLRKKKFSELCDRASEILKSTVEGSDDEALVKILRAEGLICLNEGEQARVILETYRDHLIYGYRATSTLGVYWGSKNQWDKAALLFTMAVAVKPDHDVSLSGLGMAALLKGEREQAWEFFSRAHAANPENLRALTGMIEVAYPLKRLAALEQALIRYLDYVPGNLSILYAHAGCAYALGKKDVAVEQLSKIKIFDNQHSLANELLAKIEQEDAALQANLA